MSNTPFERCRAAMAEARIDAWLIHDFRGGNPNLAAMLPGKRWTTRRVDLVIPRVGEPVVLVHGIDASQFGGCGVRQDVYLRWQEYREKLGQHLAGAARVAMEYTPGGGLPVVSIADAGTVDLVRSFGCEVVSSANLIQAAVAVWSAEAAANHARASAATAKIKDEAFTLIRERLSSGKSLTEREVQAFILGRFAAEGLETADAPVVAVNEHAGDPHFEVQEHGSSEIRMGDWLLIDLWARVPGDENIYSDITWTAYAGAQAPEKHRAVFGAVKGARDAALALVREAWTNGRTVRGCDADDAAQRVLREAGFGEFVRHRTGHSLSAGPKVHGVGVNIDNLETHDTREIMPGIGFTIEPGLYLPEFGVRNEINVYMDPVRGPVVTSCVQDEIVRLA